MTESQIERRVVAYCHKQGLLTYKFVSPSGRGVPDRIIIGFGKILFLELKQAGRKPTELQQYEIDRINHHGGLSVMADAASGYDEAKRLIDETFEL